MISHKFTRLFTGNLTRKRLLILAIAVALVCLAAGLIYRNSRPKSQPKPKPHVGVYQSPKKPDEKKPENKTYQWKGQPTDPKYLTLASISVEGFIQPVWVDQNKQIGVPANIHVAGWFTDGAKPGQKGLSIIDGHVDGYTMPGIFKNLIMIKVGASAEIELGNGQRIKYRVMSVKSIPTDQSASELFSQDPKITSELKLITCGGKFNSKAHMYEERVIVSLAQVK